MRSVDVRALLRTIAVPTLYLHASRDRIVGRHLGQQLIDGLRDVELREIDGPHLLLQSRPRECGAVIREFIERRVHS